MPRGCTRIPAEYAGLKPCARGCFATEILRTQEDLGCPKGDYFSAQAGAVADCPACCLKTQEGIQVFTMILNTFTAALGALLCMAALQAAPAEVVVQSEKPAIVLVHGAFADGSSWSKVIPLLQAKGYHVVSVQNP